MKGVHIYSQYLWYWYMKQGFHPYPGIEFHVLSRDLHLFSQTKMELQLNATVVYKNRLRRPI